MDQTLPLLQNCFLGKGLSQQDLAGLLASLDVSTETFEKGALLYAPHQYQQRLALVLSGQVEVYKLPQHGAPVLLNVLKKGDLFGAASMFHSYGYYITQVQAKQKSQVLFIGQQALLHLLSHNATALENYITFLTGRIYFLNRKIDAYTSGSAESKLALYLADQMDGGGRVELLFGMNKLAALLNIGRASLYRAVEQLEQKGVLRREGKTIVVLQPDVLYQL